MAKIFSQSDVATHKKPDDLWVVVDEDVYDLTKFQTEHPGRLIAKHDLGCTDTDWMQVARKVSSLFSAGCNRATDMLPQFFNESVVKTPQSNSGNITTRVFLRNTRVNCK